MINNWTDGAFELADGTDPTPLTVSDGYSNGDMSWDGLSPDQAAEQVYKSRGRVVAVRKGDSIEPTFSFSAMLDEFTDTVSGTFVDFAKAIAGTPYENRVSTGTDLGDIFMCTATWTVTDSDGTVHRMIATKCSLAFSTSEGDPNTLNVSGTVYGTVTFEKVPAP